MGKRMAESSSAAGQLEEGRQKLEEERDGDVMLKGEKRQGILLRVGRQAPKYERKEGRQRDGGKTRRAERVGRARTNTAAAGGGQPCLPLIAGREEEEEMAGLFPFAHINSSQFE
ncbi:hypothetical protein GPALN_010996 [Globodera pallida]|nr:hypothetical protein GPALN_010996 [Globodera pallida]